MSYKGKRFKLTREGIQYDLSEYQYLMLARKRLTPDDPMEWGFEQRIKSLVRQGLFRKRNGAFERTKLGLAVYTKIYDRVTKPKESNVPVR